MLATVVLATLTVPLVLLSVRVTRQLAAVLLAPPPKVPIKPPTLLMQ